MTSSAQNAPLDDAFQIVSQIRRIVRVINLHSQELSRQVGLTVPQLVLLQSIKDSDSEGATATHLSNKLGVNAATMSGLVARLVRKGALSRKRRAGDRRVVELFLTEEGAELLERAPSPLHGQVLSRLQHLDDHERTALLASLARIVKLMEAGELDASPLLAPGATISDG